MPWPPGWRSTAGRWPWSSPLPPEVFRLLKFGRMDSGTVRNAVSGKTLLLGSLRAFQDEVFFALRDGLVQIGQAVAEETGCQVTVHTNDGYPAVWNPEDLYDQVRACGVAFQELEKPVMISEDFSWYQRHLPGLFFFLGCGPAPALHADNFTFDEAILAKGSAFWKALAAAFKGRTHKGRLRGNPMFPRSRPFLLGSVIPAEASAGPTGRTRRTSGRGSASA